MEIARDEDIFGYQRCWNMELDHLNIPAKAAVCNDPDSCCHHIDLQGSVTALWMLC